MDFYQIDVYTKSEAISMLTIQLSELGITGFVIHDSADFEDFLENKEMNWDYIDDDLLGLKNQPTYITAYVPCNEQGNDLLNGIKGALQELKKSDINDMYGSLKMVVDSVNEEDWANNWKQYYKPLKVGEKIIIKPTWEDIDEPGNRKILEIDPGATFGTGQHYTTQLCIEQLEKVINNGDKMLDLGCGSGILSITALLLGADNVTMVDVFENAVKTASENVEQNHFDKSHYRAFFGNIIDDEKLVNNIGTGFDIITANIVADVIISMSSIFKKFLKPSGKIIISGIINERLDEVKDALSENNINIEAVHERNDWNAIICTI